jgi:cytochrome oxidase Cu insertion factor (SCO1/SenC/PrrC family)
MRPPVLVACALGLAARLAAAGAVATAGGLGAADPADLGYTYAVGAFAPEYVPPAPGTYTLPVVDTLSDHPVLDADGSRTTLFALTAGRLAVVAFVYTTCVEAAGCPVSLAVLQRVDRALADDPELSRRVALVTISFDPERDRPERMATVRRLHRPRADWRFLTTSGEAELAPLLDDFGQPVARLRWPDGRWTGLYRHVLKVFLVDTQRRVRNVYSVGFLNPALVLNDLRTVLMQGDG